MVKCPDCKVEFPEGTNFCTKCGEKLFDKPCPFCKGKMLYAFSKAEGDIVIGSLIPKVFTFDWYVCQDCGFMCRVLSSKNDIDHVIGRKKQSFF